MRVAAQSSDQRGRQRARASPGVEQMHFAPGNLEQRRRELRDRIGRQELPLLVLLVQVVRRCRSIRRKRGRFTGNVVRMDGGGCHKLCLDDSNVVGAINADER